MLFRIWVSSGEIAIATPYNAFFNIYDDLTGKTKSGNSTPSISPDVFNNFFTLAGKQLSSKFGPNYSKSQEFDNHSMFFADVTNFEIEEIILKAKNKYSLDCSDKNYIFIKKNLSIAFHFFSNIF